MSASYLLRAPGDEMDAWKAKASADGVAFAEWIRRAARAALTEPGGMMGSGLSAADRSASADDERSATLAGPGVGVPQTPEAEAVPHAASPDAPIVGASGPASTATLTEPKKVTMEAHNGPEHLQVAPVEAISGEGLAADRPHGPLSLGSVSTAKRKRHPLAKETAPRKRTAICPHRRAPDEFCSRCDA